LATNTVRNLSQSRRYRTVFFGADRQLHKITGADADAFGPYMLAKYAKATSARVIKHARQFFKSAIWAKFISENLFLDVRAGSMEIENRIHFVSREVAEKLIEAAPSLQWRVIIALSRWGGVRTPSEHLAVTWDDIDWVRERFLVRSTKTGQRWVPLFPELKPHLGEAFNFAYPGLYVVNKSRDAGSSWRTMFEKISKRAGLMPCDRSFQNLRASRETELVQTFPLHVVVKWIGNSARVAASHYLTVTDVDFARAIAGGAQVAHKAAQTVERSSRREETEEVEKDMSGVDLSLVPSTPDNYCTLEQIPLTGVEPPATFPKNSHISETDDVKSDAVPADSPSASLTMLAKIVAGLNPEERAAMARMLAAGSEGDNNLPGHTKERT